MFGFLRSNRSHVAYRQAYARCCRYQHLYYGAGSLPFLSYEGVFLYLVATDAGICPAPPKDSAVCCRLQTSRSLLNEPDADIARFCASVGLILASIKLDDDVRDDRSWLARFVRWRLSRRFRQASDHFSQLDPDFRKTVEDWIDFHLVLEKERGRLSLANYCEPTAQAFGYVFGLLARLNQADDEFRELLVRLGEHIGAAILAFDCAVDWRSDRRKGSFNPLVDSADVEAAFDYSRTRLVAAGWLCEDRLGSKSVALSVLRTVFERVSWHRSRHANNKLERWGLIREPGFVYARFECCAIFEICGALEGCTVCGEGCGVCGVAQVGCCDSCICPCDCCVVCDDDCTGGKKKKPSESEANQQSPMIGMIGRTQTTLNPSGIVVIGEVSQPAKSEGELIPADTRVEVVRATSFGLVVRQVK